MAAAAGFDAGAAAGVGVDSVMAGEDGETGAGRVSFAAVWGGVSKVASGSEFERLPLTLTSPSRGEGTGRPLARSRVNRNPRSFAAPGTAALRTTIARRG